MPFCDFTTAAFLEGVWVMKRVEGIAPDFRHAKMLSGSNQKYDLV